MLVLLERSSPVAVQRDLRDAQQVDAVPSEAAAILESSLDIPVLDAVRREHNRNILAVHQDLAAKDVVLPVVGAGRADIDIEDRIAGVVHEHEILRACAGDARKAHDEQSGEEEHFEGLDFLHFRYAS